MKPITKRERDTLNFIKKFMLKNNVTPTVRDMCKGIGIKSPSTAMVHFHRLIELGYIIPYKDTARYQVKGIKFVEEEE